MLGSAADLVRPVEPHSAEPAGIIAWAAELLAKATQWLLSRVLFGAHLLLLWIGQRDSQRAEYLADELAAKTAGSAAAASLSDTMLAMGVVEMVVRREARAGRGPAHWRAAANEARAAMQPRIPALRQLSIRDEVSLFASHPPHGLRSRMVETREWHDATVVLTESRSEQIDTELAKHYARAGRDIAWSS